jgi:hypothetical protein
MNQVYLDAHLQALSRDVLAFETQDALDAISLYERQRVIRNLYLPEESPDKVGNYAAKIKVMLDKMSAQLLAGGKPEAVALSERDMATKSLAYRNNELHIFNRAFRSMEKFMEPLSIPKGAGGRPTVKYLPKGE